VGYPLGMDRTLNPRYRASRLGLAAVRRARSALAVVLRSVHAASSKCGSRLPTVGKKGTSVMENRLPLIVNHFLNNAI